MITKSVRVGIGGNETHTTNGQVHCDIPYAYVQAVENAGGVPLVLAQTAKLELIEAQLDTVEGVLLPGGADVHPLLWGAEPEENLEETLPFLDRYQMQLARKAIERGMPLLGICRGCQILNVALGGTLIQHIQGNCLQHRQKSVYKEPAHWVTLEQGSLLHNLWGPKVAVNTLHHQAVKEPGRGLTVVGRASDGIAEALEMNDKPFVVGVQWHPEGMVPEDSRMVQLFEKFMEHGALYTSTSKTSLP